MRTTTVDVGVPFALRSWGDSQPIFFLHAMGPVSSGAIVGAAVDPRCARLRRGLPAWNGVRVSGIGPALGRE
jgi:hypothetical protein